MHALRHLSATILAFGLFSFCEAKAAVGFTPKTNAISARSEAQAPARCAIAPALRPIEQSSHSPFEAEQVVLPGSQLSRLAQIIQAQNGHLAGGSSALGVPSTSLAPTATKACGNGTGYINAARSSALSHPSGYPRFASNDFLSSQRVAIGRTPFDSAWERVGNRHLSAQQAAVVLGRHHVNLPTGSLEILQQINVWTNEHIRYVEDRRQYLKDDYWADAATTLQRRAGDCEDIAILKMQLLEAAGFAPSSLFLTIAHDPIRKGDHAVLVVKVESGFLLLDNNTSQILDGSTSPVLQPVFSFSGNSKWLHGFVR